MQPRFRLQLHKPFIDLVEIESPNFYAAALLRSVEILDLADPPSLGWTQRGFSSRHREDIVTICGFDRRFVVSDPTKLDPDLASDSWQRIMLAAAKWPSLSMPQRVNFERVLNLLGFHRYFNRLMGRLDGDFNDEWFSYLKFRAITTLAIEMRSGLEEASRENISTLRRQLRALLDNVPRASINAFRIAKHLILVDVTFRKDPVAARVWADLAFEFFERADISAFWHKQFLSQYYRAASMVPMAQGNPREMCRQMDLCEALSHECSPTTPDEKLVKEENLYSVYESRTKEALVTGDLSRAMTYATELVRRFPFDSKALVELGDVLVKKGDFRSAGIAYLKAGDFGPPAAPLAYFMAAQCFSQLPVSEGKYLNALSFSLHQLSAEEDLLGISPRRRLAEYRTSSGVRNWAQQGLAQL